MKSKGFIETDALVGFAIMVLTTTVVLALAYVHQGYDQTITNTIELIDQEVSLGLSSIDTCVITYVPEPSEETQEELVDESFEE